MVINDGLRRGNFMIESACHRRLEEEIVVDERHAAPLEQNSNSATSPINHQW
jgi:hypothetical protein